MFYCTHNNHFQFGWGTGTFNFTNKIGNYWVKFGRAQYIPTSFRSECVRAAKLIFENSQKPLLVCFSGGIDSEVIVRSLLEAKVYFEVVIMKLNYKDQKNINSHDNIYAFNFAKKNNIKINEFDFDLEDFIKNKFKIEANKFGNYLGILIHTEIVKSFPDYHCILGGGDINLKRHRYNGRKDKEGLYIEEGEISINAMEAAYYQKNGVSNRFFMHTPELMLAWLLDKDISHFIKYEKALASRYGTINSGSMKAFAYHRNWPDLIPRPKFNGFEKLTLWDQDKKNENDPTIIEIIEQIQNDQIINSKKNVIIDYEQLMESLVPS